METYARHLLVEVTKRGGETTKRPISSTHTLVDALLDLGSIEGRDDQFGAPAGRSYEVIDLEHLHMGNMADHFKVEDGRLTPVA